MVIKVSLSMNWKCFRLRFGGLGFAIHSWCGVWSGNLTTELHMDLRLLSMKFRAFRKQTLTLQGSDRHFSSKSKTRIELKGQARDLPLFLLFGADSPCVHLDTHMSWRKDLSKCTQRSQTDLLTRIISSLQAICQLPKPYLMASSPDGTRFDLLREVPEGGK